MACAPKPDSPPQDARDALLKAVPVASAAGALVVYGLLILAYSQFYAELGVRSSEVGLQYGPGVGGIAGVALMVILASLFTTGLVVGAVLAFNGLRRLTKGASAKQLWPNLLRTPTAIWSIGAAVMFIVCLAALVTFVFASDREADNVKEGRWTEPLRILGIEILALRADPATVAPVARKPGDADTLAPLRESGTRLFYLGRSGGTVVLYAARPKPATGPYQRVWHLPASSVILRTSNCESKQSRLDPLCKR